MSGNVVHSDCYTTLYPANQLGTSRFTRPVYTGGGARRARFVRVSGRAVDMVPAANGSSLVRVYVQFPDNGQKSADGTGALSHMTGREYYPSVGASVDVVPNTLATGVATTLTWGATFDLNSSTGNAGECVPISNDFVTLRISNTGSGWGGGTVYVDTIELLD